MSFYEPSEFPSRRPRPSSAGSAAGVLVMLVLLFLGGGLLLWYFWPGSKGGPDPAAKTRTVTERGPLFQDEADLVELYEKALPSIVHINNLANRVDRFGLNAMQVPRGSGSGFVWDDEGHIVTNYHVVAGANVVEVVLSDRTSYQAKNAWVYPDKDIAVLTVDAPKSKLKPIPLGSSHDLKVGQKAIVIGNPFGLDGTLTTGVISALNREITSEDGHPIQGVVQTSAPINPGNSGGPLLDSAGRLVGITTAILSPSGAFAGIGFAIPADEVNEVVTQLIQKGKVERPRLGVVMASDQQARQAGIREGVVIIKVIPDSPAAKAGLRPIDVIIAVDTKPVKSSLDLLRILEKYKIGDTVELSFTREGEKQQVQLVLEAVG